MVSALDRVLELGKQWLMRAGIVVMRREFVPFGLDLFADTAALSRVLGHEVRVFFDVGANVGQTSLRAATVFPNAAIHAFEPHPGTFRHLLAQTGSNERIRPNNLALGESDGEVDFYDFGDSKINSMIANSPYVQKFEKKATKIKVACTTIAQFCDRNELPGIDVLKIDTEGFDLSVLKGAKPLLEARKVKFIWVEFNSLSNADGRPGSLAAIADFLEPYDVKFVASYIDYVIPGRGFFVSANALFVLPSAETGAAADGQAAMISPNTVLPG